ncbi:MAG: Alpha,alpha-trehalase [Candidatus Curtissbacteria bacterium GW2011_GWA1_40_16]|uniref:Alpha,alpha-trehalase n=1 Tax=Candidatus Curtissbacteria bacterium GW2011_GWA1_40_16 TaxID=1618405 RepID=A0A0G0RJY0_9BACT|nr:MAG: Alpha,alpha-trehalase [Candidatus Curtissbacteria bacterium GW2011_GWA1_40_16]
MDTAKIAKQIRVSEKDLNSVLKYIEDYWPKLIREHKEDLRSLIGLPNPYIVPADGDVFQEQYYWDSYPIVRALINHPKYSKLAIGMVDNLLYLVKRFGIVPNASRFYFLSRSQPPVFSTMVFLVYEKTKNKKWFSDAIRLVEEEYKNVWMGKIHLRNFRNVYRGLSRYYDINAVHSLAEIESGWDMTSRFMGKCMDILPVDLNCFLYKYEDDLEKAYGILENNKKSERYKELKSKRVRAINQLMWDERAGYFFDYDWVGKKRSHLITVAGVFPLAMGIATKKQAEGAVKVIEKTLQKKYGVVQSVKFVENFQWDWPNGWAPMQLRVVEGLLNYGYDHLAQRVIAKWLSGNVKVFKETGYLWEKYDVVSGRVGVPDRYPTQPGFGWTNAVFLILLGIASGLSEGDSLT